MEINGLAIHYPSMKSKAISEQERYLQFVSSILAIALGLLSTIKFIFSYKGAIHIFDLTNGSSIILL